MEDDREGTHQVSNGVIGPKFRQTPLSESGLVHAQCAGSDDAMHTSHHIKCVTYVVISVDPPATG